ncbi:hypothetical protein [Sorangium cellulosum]|uniref:hypothetical protein n=1 Tax=Sorangium cellulosum TaxID=56 RepID=UPI0011DC90ED|nr:hypothetical protein [Sorangium cellulosum]
MSFKAHVGDAHGGNADRVSTQAAPAIAAVPSFAPLTSIPIIVQSMLPAEATREAYATRLACPADPAIAASAGHHRTGIDRDLGAPQHEDPDARAPVAPSLARLSTAAAALSADRDPSGAGCARASPTPLPSATRQQIPPTTERKRIMRPTIPTEPPAQQPRLHAERCALHDKSDATLVMYSTETPSSRHPRVGAPSRTVSSSRRSMGSPLFGPESSGRAWT